MAYSKGEVKKKYHILALTPIISEEDCGLNLDSQTSISYDSCLLFHNFDAVGRITQTDRKDQSNNNLDQAAKTV